MFILFNLPVILLYLKIQLTHLYQKATKEKPEVKVEYNRDYWSQEDE